MPPPPTVPASVPSTVQRVRVFIDFWNFQLSVNRELAAKGTQYSVDWRALGPWLAQEAALLVTGGQQPTSYEGMLVYLSYNPKQPKDAPLKQWATNTLDRFPGVQVTVMERKPKDPPDCPVCHQAVTTCPHCSGSMAGTVEKGIDTAIVTDMIRLAWESSYDIAVLVSSDRDFIPAVEFLDSKGIKIVQAGFPPRGSDLAKRCWGSLDLKKTKPPQRTNVTPPTT